MYEIRIIDLAKSRSWALGGRRSRMMPATVALTDKARAMFR